MTTPFWRSDSCTVTVSVTAEGAIRFDGHDLRAFGTAGHEYEYVVTVDAAHVPTLRQVLGVAAEADLLAELTARCDEVMSSGEAGWLTDHGIVHHVSVWDHPPD